MPVSKPAYLLLKVAPMRWPVARIFQSWKRALPVASLKTTKEAPTVCSLYGRMRLMLLQYARCPRDEQR
jgi:hypothetical protein